MRYLVHLGMCVVLLTGFGCSVSREIMETEPPPDQRPLTELDDSPRRQIEDPAELPAEGP